MRIKHLHQDEYVNYIRRKNTIESIETTLARLISNIWLNLPEKQAVLYQTNQRYDDIKEEIDRAVMIWITCLTELVLLCVDPNYGSLQSMKPAVLYDLLSASKNGLLVLGDSSDISLDELMLVLSTLNSLAAIPTKYEQPGSCS